MHDAKALQSRLNEFARAYSRAEIARKTETSVVNVSRYLKGTRVPAEFCMALVRQFGVNANWLLAGQGSLFVSDLATQHGQMAGDLLELVEAMSAVAKMRLGSIAGRDHMKLLRQLNDSLGTYERLREKLNQQSKGILADVLRELDSALAAMDMARAGALRKAAEQVARLCDDDELARRLLGTQAHHSYLTGRLDESLLLMRRRLVHTMASGRIETDEQAQGALRLVVVLNDSGRVSEALRVGMAFLALSDRNANELPSVAALGSFCGHIHSLRGEIGPALELLERWLPWQKGRQRSVTQAAMVRVHLLSGMSTFDEALTAPGLDQPRYAHILALACMAENTKVIRACMKFMDSPSGREVKERTVAPHIAPFIARGVERHDLSALRDLEARRMELSGRIGQTMEWDIFEVQLLRLLGEPVRAAKLCAAVDGEIRNLLEPESLDIAMRGQHWRNQLFLGSKEQRLNAEARIKAQVAKGCLLLRSLLADR